MKAFQYLQLLFPMLCMNALINGTNENIIKTYTHKPWGKWLEWIAYGCLEGSGHIA